MRSKYRRAELRHCRPAAVFARQLPKHQEFSNSLQPGLRLINRQVETHKPSSRPPQVKESAAPYVFVFLPKCSGAVHHYLAGREQTRAVKVTSVGGRLAAVQSIAGDLVKLSCDTAARRRRWDSCVHTPDMQTCCPHK